ncbi:MAG TPA: hypothetical protein VGG77_07025 [Roseiarcus sp.]
MPPRLHPFVEARIDRYRQATRFARSVEEYADIALGEFAPAGTVHLFKASLHAYGPGKTHLVDETRRATFCGKDLARVPGAALWSLPDDIDCRGCLAAIERQKQRQGPWTD